MAKISYVHWDSTVHGYQGIEITKEEVEKYFPKEVLAKLKDSDGTQQLLDAFSDSLPMTGFDVNQKLLEIFSIETSGNAWRIGEAFAELFLESQEGARFHWSELRDQRNVNSNKTGADLVGFIDIDGAIVFLFGEVKTSNDADSPPQVLYGKTGMIRQLEDLIDDQVKINTLIRYLGTKVMLYEPTHPFRSDYVSALKNFTENSTLYSLFGILVRDTASNEKDIKARYHSLKKKIKTLPTLRLMALYIPVTQSKWQEIVNNGSK